MKKVLTLILSFSTLYSVAQGPTIEGTYLPVKGTAIKQVWDTLPGTIDIPQGGINMTWNYYGKFPDASLTYKIATFSADTTPYISNFNTPPDSATHASYLTSPLRNTADSLYSYYIVDRNDGLYMLGGRSEKNPPAFSGPAAKYYMGFDTTYTITNTDPMRHGELYAPVNISYTSGPLQDTTLMITYGAAYSGSFFNVTVPLKLKEWKYKDFKAIGYGTLIMPDSTVYNDVLLARIKVKAVDSIFNASDGSFISNTTIAQLGLSGSVQNPTTRTLYQYAFLRNNTFGSAYLMYLLGADTTAGSFINGWYSLPVDFGYVSGTVYTDDTEDSVVTHGEARLYRENSNFAKFDILDRCPLDTNGHYKFDSIPYGTYRVAVRTDTSIYNRALTTYYGDTTDWVTATSITTFGDSTSDGHKIHLQYYPDSLGTNDIQGQLYWNFSIEMSGQPNVGGMGLRQNAPIPGIDVVVKKKPSGSAFGEPKTDSTGQFSLGNLPDGEYTLHVDIPGCPHETTYDFCISGGQTLGILDFHCGTQYLHALNDIDTTAFSCNPITTSTATAEEADITDIQVYPNPYTFNTTIKINLSRKSDVTLEVYNLLGEKVQVLDNSTKLAGMHSYNYSATAVNRPAGVYFVHLIANGKISVLKIVEQ